MNEQRHPHSSLQRSRAKIEAKLQQRQNNGQVTESSADIMEALTLGRAASDLDAVATFYLDGMQTTETLSYDSDDVSKRCYLWAKQNATVDICFTKRSDSATSTDFTVLQFETMLKTVHENVINEQDTAVYGCNNKWADNHYAIDPPDIFANYDYIVDYVDSTEGLYVYCYDENTFHYLTDPTGWGIQLDINFNYAPAACASSSKHKLQEQGAPPPPMDDHLPPPMDLCPCTGIETCGFSGSGKAQSHKN
jgi:hypothetical protein